MEDFAPTLSCSAHRQAVAAEQATRPRDFVTEPEAGFVQQFASRDFHSRALDFRPVCDACGNSLLYLVSTLNHTSHRKRWYAVVIEKMLQRRHGVPRQKRTISL